MADNSNLTYSDKGWNSGCGCHGKAKVLVTLPENSVTVHFHEKKVQEYLGPITGIRYSVNPVQASIDIHKDDAEQWVKNGIAEILTPQNIKSKNIRGRLTRQGV